MNDCDFFDVDRESGGSPFELEDSGCGCALPGSRGRTAAALAAAAVILAVIAARRRQRGDRP